MKGFLFDENVPRQILISTDFPVLHAMELADSTSDREIWAYAKEHDWVVVTKDADFSNRMMVSTPPPWAVHLRFRNMRRRDYHAFLQRVWPQIEQLLPRHKLLNVYLERIEAIYE